MKKKFETAAVASVTSGIMVTDEFSKVHDVVDFFFRGCFTHQLPDLQPIVAEKILLQYPDFKDTIGKETWSEDTDTLIAILGSEVELENGQS